MVNLYNDGRRRQESDCLVPRRLSFDVRAKEGGKETTGFARHLDPSHGPLRFITSHTGVARSPLPCENEAPEEEAGNLAFLIFKMASSASSSCG